MGCMLYRVGFTVGWGPLCTVLLLASTAAGQNPEFRAMWISRFEWPSTSEATAKATIDSAMADLAANNFNAVFFQVRGQADVLYPSPHEVWSPLIGGSDPGWDPLAYAIQSAHANGIEFHAYINTHTCWQSVPASAHTLPANLNHIFYQHFNASDLNARDWLHHIAEGNPVQFSESEYVWFAPGVPDAQAYTRKQIEHVAANYDVDGIHYDRIRTPWSNQPSFDPISLVRFNNPQSNPEGLDFTAWTADQITRQVRDMYAAIMSHNPDIKVSAAVFNNPNAAPTAQHQEASRWLQTGGLDINVPMLYFTGNAGSTWDLRLQQWIAESAGRHVVAGQITSQGVSSLLSQIALTRTRAAEGNSVFSLTSFGFWSNYLANVYQSPAALPPMSWKDNPTTAIIYGFALDANSNAVVDAQVTRDGSSYVGLSTGDAFYSLLLVPPGTYTLSASHPAYGTVNLPGVTVAAGDVLRQDFSFGFPQPPVIAEVAPDPAAATAGVVYTQQLVLSQGTADNWTPIDIPTGANLSSSGLITWTPSPADAGMTFDFTVQATNASGSDDESWQVDVDVAEPCNHLLISDFEGFANGTEVLFNDPRFSGTTSIHLEQSPNVAGVTDDIPGFSGTASHVAQWEWIDTSPQRWTRLTTFNVSNVPNPTIALDRPIRVRIRVDSGRFRLAVGVRETASAAALGDDGGTGGTIEWIGAGSDIGGAPQGVLVEPMPGVWQTFIFDPATDPIHPLNGDGELFTPNMRGTFEHLAFSLVDTAGPLTVYVDDVEQLCSLPPFGDLDGDGDVTLADYALFAECLQGPDVSVFGDCTDADADEDGDVDLRDAAALAALLGE